MAVSCETAAEVADLMRRGERGYLYDPEFHARVKRAVNTVEQAHGGYIPDYARATAIQAACVALALTDGEVFGSDAR